MEAHRPWVDSFKGNNVPVVHVHASQNPKMKADYPWEQYNELVANSSLLVANTKHEAGLLDYFVDKILLFQQVHTWSKNCVLHSYSNDLRLQEFLIQSSD